MKRLFWLGLASLLLSLQLGASAQLAPLSFEEAMRVSLAENPKIKQAAQFKKQREQEAKAAKGLYLPKVSLTASFVRMSKDLTMDMGDIRDAIAPIYQTLGNYGNFSGVPNPDPKTNGVMPVLPDDVSTQAVRKKMLEGYDHLMESSWDVVLQKKQFGIVAGQVSWPIFAGFKIRAANKAASFRVEEADEKLRQYSGELMTELVKRYFGVCLANEALAVHQKVFSAMDGHLNDAEKLFEQGQIAKAELLHARMKQDEAKRKVMKAERQLQIISEALNNTLNRQDSIKVLPTTKLFYLTQIEDLNYYTLSAQTNSPLLKQVDWKAGLAQQKLTAEKANYYPTIAAMANYDIANYDLSHVVPKSLVGVGLKWTLFDGIARTRKVRAAKAMTEQVHFAKEKATNDIKMALSKFYKEVQIQLEQLRSLDTAMEFATEYARVRQKAFTEGMATSVEVVDANLAVAGVKIERLKAAYDFDVALIHLLNFSGKSEDFVSYLKRENVVIETYAN